MLTGTERVKNKCFNNFFNEIVLVFCNLVCVSTERKHRVHLGDYLTSDILSTSLLVSLPIGLTKSCQHLLDLLNKTSSLNLFIIMVQNTSYS